MSGPIATELPDDGGIPLGSVTAALRAHIRLLTIGPLTAAALAFGAAHWMPPTFTAVTTFMPPQQAQSSAASAVAASLGSLAGLAGSAVGLRTSADQYVGLMRSVTVADRLIDRFGLREAYDVKFRVDARKQLMQNVRINVGKKDGMVTIEVDDHDPKRAADMANQYIDELRRLVATLAVTEAQQRRLFFEHQLKAARDSLVGAQQALQTSGFDAGALKAEPKAAAEAYARLKADATSAEIRLQVLRGSLADSTPEVQQQQASLSALRAQLARAERSADASTGGPDYVSRYREFKYQEALFELYARQFELARVDESREGALIQVVDAATPPERRSKPKPALVAVVTLFASFVVLGLTVVARRRPPLQAR